MLRPLPLVLATACATTPVASKAPMALPVPQGGGA